MDVFDVIWLVASRDGVCDTIGSVEYLRCRQAWDEGGEIAAIIVFIRREANTGPDLPPIPASPDGGMS